MKLLTKNGGGVKLLINWGVNLRFHFLCGVGFFCCFFYRKFVNLIYVFERNLCMYIFMTILTTKKLKCSVFLWNTKSLKISTWLPETHNTMTLKEKDKNNDLQNTTQKSRELSWVAANTNVSLLFGSTGIEPTISCILGEHANNFPTEVHNTNLKAGWMHALMRGKQFTALLVALAKWSKIFKIEECIFWQLWYI